MEIRVDDMRSPAVRALLEDHRRSMLLHSPPGSVHALDLDGLRVPEITFYTVWDEKELLGCGALKALAGHCGEIKSMRTAAGHLRRGVAKLVLSRIVTDAQCQNYGKLFLETGTGAAFAPACSLYERFGFVQCPPFGDYLLDPFSTFMCLDLGRPS